MKILSSHFAAICDKYDSPAPNGSFARRCEAARSSEKNSLTAKIFKYALTAALFLLATAFLIGAAAGYWIIVSRSDVPTSGICSYDSTNLLRYYLADESSDQFGKALNGDLGSASATYDGEFHFPIVSKTPIKKFDGYDKALLPLQFADFNYGGDLTQAYFDDFGYEYVLLTGFSAGAKISPENIKTSAEILKNQSNYTWIAGVPSDAGVYAVRITSLEEVTVVGSPATRSKYGSYIVIYTIAPATATITEAAPLGGSFIVENASSAQSAATMADDSIAGGDGTFIYGVDESGKPLNQGVKVTSLTLGGSSHSVSGYSDISVGSVKNGLNIVLSDNVKSAANHSEADNENFWYTVTASLSGAEAGNYALSNATSLRFRIAPVELNADDIKWYYDGEATNGKTVVYDGSEHGLTALIDETTVSNRYYAKYGNDESVKSAVKSLIDAINGGSAPLTLGVYARSNDNYTAAIPSTAKVAKNAGIYLFSADVYLGGKRSTDVYLATEATNTLTINAAKLMVNYGSDPVYNGKAQQPTFTLAGLIGNDGMGVNAKVTQDAAVVEPINVGPYTLTLSVSGETYLNYVFGKPTLTTETSTSHIYKIIPKPVSLTTSNVSNITYDGEVHAPTATYSDVSGANVDAVTSITKDGTVINANDVKNAGAYTLTASLKGTTNYVWDDNTTADKTYNWTISKLKITVEVTNANQSATYNGAEPTINTDTTVTLTGSVASVPPCVSNELLFSVTKETGVNAGTYTLTPSAKAKSGYFVDNYDITPTNGTFTINKAALTVTANSENITYGDDKPTFSVSYSGFVNNENESVLGGSLVLECDYVKYENVRTYSITPSGLTSGNYAITFESGKLTVRKKQITATISLLSDSIYVTDHVLTVANPSVEFSGLVNGDTLTVTYTAVNNETTVATTLTDSTTLKKGVYTVNAVFSGDKAGNYDITATAATLTAKEYDGTVTKVAVPVANTGLVYNASKQDGITHNQANYDDYYTVSGTASATNAGDYSVTVTLKDKTNCVWDDNTTDDKTYNWTISKANITIAPTVTSETFIYGTEIPESTISYNIEGTNYNNELTISLVLKDSGSGKICELPSVLDAGTYNVSVDVSGGNINNYNVKKIEDNFTVTPLEVKFSGIININYTDTDKTLNATLLKKGLVKSSDSSSIENLSMPSFSSAVARTYDSSNDDNKAYTETKDAQGNITSISGEHGYYKVTLNSAFTVGSTYKVTAVLNSDNYAFVVGSNTIIVKYKTAKIGSTYYTIEDALSESASGNITLAGDSSGNASYIITSFTKLTYGELTAGYTQKDIDNYFKNYKDCSSTNETINHYTLSGKTLIVPYADGVTASSTESTSAGTDKVYSALIIPNDITLNISSTMNITAEVRHIGTSNVCQVSARGVVMNNGTINVKNGANILAYGYLKGSGTVNLESGATATDLFRIFDFKGGSISRGINENAKAYFPINSYSLHNISCKTRVYSGAIYKAHWVLTAGNKWFDGTVDIIGTSTATNALFKLSTGYIEKSAKPAASWTSSDEEYTALDTIVGSNQICGQIDVIDICGNVADGQVSIKITLAIFTVNMKTSTDTPLPIPYMDITVRSNGTLNLSNSSYKFMPGAKLTVEEGATLETASGVQLVMYSTSQCNSAENFEGNPKPFYPGLCADQTDALLIVNGTATINGRVSGKITANASNAIVKITQNNTQITVLNKVTPKTLNADVTTRNFSANAIGNTVDGDNQNLENTTTYKSQEVGSNIVWVKAKNIKTITFDSCGGTLISSKTIILTNDSFTIPATNEDGSAYLETPSLDYYTFVGWFTAKDGGDQISAGSIVYAASAVNNEIKLYAHWAPNTYQIVHEWTHSENSEYDFSSADIVCPLDEYKAGETLTLAAPTTTATDLSFVAWYDKDGNQISNITLSNIANLLGDDGKLHILGNWTNKRVVTYTVSIIVGNKDLYNSDFTVACETEITATEGEYKDFTPTVNDSKGIPLNSDYGTAVTNYNYAKYFVGWYTDESFTSPYTYKINGDTTLYAKWEDKIETTIEFKDTNNTELLSSITKFFIPGFNINKELLDSIHNELGFLESINAGKDHKEYYFDKWFVGNEELKSQAISLTENVVIKAQYKRCYHIIISGDDGITPKNETIYVDPSETMYSLTINGSSDNNNGSRYRIIEYSIEINGSTQTTTINNETTTIDININLPSDSSKDITVSLTTQIQYQITINNGSYTPMTVKLGGASGEDIKSGNYYDGGVKIYVKSNGEYGIVDTAHNDAKIVGSQNASATVELKNTLALQATTDSCIAAGTLITLWDGSKKKVEDLTNADVLLVFNHETGAYDYAKLLINEHQGQSYDYYSVMNLYFSDGSVLKIIKEHGFFDLDLNRYVYINENNYSNYIGHKFFQTDWNGSEFVGREVTLDNVAIKTEYTAIFSPVTEKHFNIFTENILSVSTELDGLLNIFEYGENMQYDEEKMKADIEKYGLFTYEDWKDYVSKDIYDLIPFKYYKVAIGKGYITMEHMHELIEKYFYKFYAAQNDNNNDEQISCQTSG
ncbi:filamentous haemagglutinin family outer membrane protein [Firmicutes bacterium CAG:552]|nr:filamentous haemagglutinin family outer membrane protein [Firmicutes bacterium CAG:552]